jgi:hypothetical protein
MIKQFIENASVEGIDGDCLKRLPRPSYFQAMVEKPKPAPITDKSGAKP